MKTFLMSLLRCVPCSLVLFLGLDMAWAAEKKATPTSERPKLESSQVWGDYRDTRFHRFRLNTALGMNIIKGSALVSGMQFGYAPSISVPIYVGPEFNFSLFSPGNMFALLATAWYQFHIQGTSKLGLATGISVGPGFVSGIDYLPTTPMVALLDLSITQDVDDLVSIRGQFRPGLVAQHFTFQMNFNVSYRFP